MNLSTHQNLSVTSQFVSEALLHSFTDKLREAKTQSHPTPTCPVEVQQGVLCLVSAPIWKQVPFHSPSSATLFALMGFLLVISLFTVAPKNMAGGLSAVPKHRKPAMGLTEKHTR